MNKEYKYNCKVEFEDCDIQNIVHHPKLLCYLERARIDSMKNTELSYKNLLKNDMGFVITDLKTKFILPAFFGEKLTIVSRVSGVYAHCIKMDQIILKTDDIELPIDNWINNEKTVLCCSIRFSIVNNKTNKPIENYKEILKKLNLDNNNNIKSVYFKHPFN